MHVAFSADVLCGCMRIKSIVVCGVRIKSVVVCGVRIKAACGSSPSWSVVCGSRLCADKSVVVCGVRIKTACGSSPADRGYIHGLKAVIFVAWIEVSQADVSVTTVTA